MKGISGAMGYILGTIVVVPLLLYLISIIFYGPRKVSPDQIYSYVNNCIDVTDSVKRYSFLEYTNSGEKIGRQIKRYKAYLDRHSTGDRRYFGYVYYSKKCNRYFNLLIISEGMGIIDGIMDVLNIQMTINKEDYGNPAYGSIDNPIPVLKVTGINKSVRYANKDYDKAYMDTVFYNNVKLYLEYIMPKKEFKARYGAK